MELGVKINPEDMLSVKMALMSWDVNKIKKDQVRHAFESYQNNGAVWRFDVTAVARETDAEDGTSIQCTLPEIPL